MKSRQIFVLILLMSVTVSMHAQTPAGDKNKELEEPFLERVAGIRHRAGGIHNAGNIGLFFENRGKLYPRRLTQGPSGEYPINSGKHYIYRINPMVGVPGNVIQGRYTTNEEWEAVGGYHNEELAKIAFSDSPDTWHPTNGWPFKDEDGNPIIKSDQDSYAVYSDSNNTVRILGIKVAQTGYQYGVKFAQNILFFKFDVVNDGNQDLEDLYFALYCDIDIGNVSGTANAEYSDDKLGFERENNLLYFYDAKGFSRDWPDGQTGYFGIAFLQTPEVDGRELGITDMHYNLYYDDIDDDDIQYGILSSSRVLYESPNGSKYFHIGDNDDIRFDDPATIPDEGLDLVATISSGPYTLLRGDTLTFYTAVIAGDDYDHMMYSFEQAHRVLEFDFEISKPPATPAISGYAGDGHVTVLWDDTAEYSRDGFSGEFDFEGYRLYRSNDRGMTWQRLADFDVVNGIGLDRGLQYSYTDRNVVNGFEYWYSVTAYDRGDEFVESLESPIGTNPDALNTILLTPKSSALGRIPVQSDTVRYIGSGASNYVLRVHPIDDDRLDENTYTVGFTYTQRTERGQLRTIATYEITDSSRTRPHRYGFYFRSHNRFDLVNLTTGDNIRENLSFVSGSRYSVDGMRIRLTDPDPDAPEEFKPKAGDVITVNFAVYAVRNDVDTVIAPRPITIDQNQATTDGVIFSLIPPDIIQQVSRIGGTDNIEFTFSVADETVVKTDLYLLSVEGRGFDTSGRGFIAVRVRNSANETIAYRDTIFNQESIEFEGIRGRAQFPSADPPAPGNIFSVETVVPVEPGIRDKYQFIIRGSQIVKETIREHMHTIRVVPNPYVVSSLYEQEFGQLRREPLRELQFINLPNECTIYIFSLAADLVKTIHHRAAYGTATWDLRADGGREIAPGVYVFVVKADGQELIGRFAVIK
jgi:hypothetical protein